MKQFNMKDIKIRVLDNNLIYFVIVGKLSNCKIK
jgi:hypothetical protein